MESAPAVLFFLMCLNYVDPRFALSLFRKDNISLLQVRVLLLKGYVFVTAKLRSWFHRVVANLLRSRATKPPRPRNETIYNKHNLWFLMKVKCNCYSLLSDTFYSPASHIPCLLASRCQFPFIMGNSIICFTTIAYKMTESFYEKYFILTISICKNITGLAGLKYNN